MFACAWMDVHACFVVRFPPDALLQLVIPLPRAPTHSLAFKRAKRATLLRVRRGKSCFLKLSLYFFTCRQEYFRMLCSMLGDKLSWYLHPLPHITPLKGALTLFSPFFTAHQLSTKCTTFVHPCRSRSVGKERFLLPMARRQNLNDTRLSTLTL